MPVNSLDEYLRSSQQLGNLNLRERQELMREFIPLSYRYQVEGSEVNARQAERLQRLQDQGAERRTTLSEAGADRRANISAGMQRDVAGIESQDRRYAADRAYDAEVLRANNNLQAIREEGRNDLDVARLGADSQRYSADRNYAATMADISGRRDVARMNADATYAQIGSNERINAAQIAQARERMGVDRELGMADIAQRYFGSMSNMFSVSNQGNSSMYSDFLKSARGF